MTVSAVVARMRSASRAEFSAVAAGHFDVHRAQRAVVDAEFDGGRGAKIQLPQGDGQGAADDVLADVEMSLAGMIGPVGDQRPAAGSGGGAHGGDHPGSDGVPTGLGCGAQKAPCLRQEITGLTHLHLFSLSLSVRVARK